MMRDASNIKLSTTILGEQISFPVCIAPSGMHMLAHPSGEMATAKGMYVIKFNSCIVCRFIASSASFVFNLLNVYNMFHISLFEL